MVAHAGAALVVVVGGTDQPHRPHGIQEAFWRLVQPAELHDMRQQVRQDAGGA